MTIQNPSKTRYYSQLGYLVFILILVPLQFLAFTTPALADPPTNNAPANNTQTTKSPGATYVGRGVESSIRALLCAPTPSNATVTNTGTFQENAQVTDNQSAGDLASCVNKGYRFALAFGAVASVFFVVLAGYMYMVGGEHGKEQAKEILVSVLAGFLIMLSSYVLLRQINPTLVAFRSIQPPQLLGKYSLPSCADAGLGENCVDPKTGATTTGNGNGGGVGTTGNRPYCIPVQKFLCDHPKDMPPGKSNYPDGVWTSTYPDLQANLNALKAAWTKMKNDNPRLDTSVKQVYRPPEYGAHMRSIFEAKALLSGWSDEKVSHHGQYCDGSIQYVKAADVKDVKPGSPEYKYINDHFSDHFPGGLGSPTTCFSDHGKGIALDFNNGGAAVAKAFETAAEAAGLCHNIPPGTSGMTSGDRPHYALKAKANVSKCTW